LQTSFYLYNETPMRVTVTVFPADRNQLVVNVGSSEPTTSQEVMHMFDELVAEVGRTVRAALESWSRTIRLVILIAVLVGAAVIWTHYCL
jgi:hypothetical protein